MDAAARAAYNAGRKEAVMPWRPLWVGFILSFVLLAFPRASYACPS
jgi:hypothetical protein